MTKRWIMGCGDIGRRLVGLYQNKPKQAIGWVKSGVSATLGASSGLSMRQGDLDLQGQDQPLFIPAEFEAAEIFWFMPPPSQGMQDKRLRYFLQQVKNAPRRILLISTTGVYGDCKGRWIDETAPLKPATDRAHRRVDAEMTLQQWGALHQREWVILRVPGIYAQDRLPLARLQRGDPVLAEAQAPWTNRIHADDLARIAHVAMERSVSGEIYNASDGHPSSMTDYFNQVADFARLPRPPQIGVEEVHAKMSAGMLSYLQESRRIRNEKLLQQLKIRLLYPNLRAGLRRR